MNGKERQQAALGNKLGAMLASGEQIRSLYLGARGRDFTLLVIAVVVIPGIAYGLTFDSLVASIVAGAVSGGLGALLAVAIVPKAVVVLTDRRLLVAKASAFPIGIGDLILDAPAAEVQAQLQSGSKNAMKVAFRAAGDEVVVIAPRMYLGEAAFVVAGLDAARS